MSSNSSRASRNSFAEPDRRLRVRIAALLGCLVVLFTAACGFDVQTSQPYTPAEGVNLDVGDPAKAQSVIHIRNLLLISSEPGVAVISGSLVTYGRDQLAQISGVPIKADGTDGAPFTADLGNTTTLANGVLVVLTQAGSITVRSPDISPGLSAKLTLTFANAGASGQTVVPIADGSQPQYSQITPSPVVASP